MAKPISHDLMDTERSRKGLKKEKVLAMCQGDKRESEEEVQRASPSMPPPLSETQMRAKQTPENDNTAANQGPEEAC